MQLKVTNGSRCSPVHLTYHTIKMKTVGTVYNSVDTHYDSEGRVYKHFTWICKSRAKIYTGPFFSKPTQGGSLVVI